jgi:cell surface protein SprA
MQFGRLTATTLFSQQRGKKQEVSVQGGAQTMYFNVSGDNYEVNKHYFLGHYFRDNYDEWMRYFTSCNHSNCNYKSRGVYY